MTRLGLVWVAAGCLAAEPSREAALVDRARRAALGYLESAAKVLSEPDGGSLLAAVRAGDLSAAAVVLADDSVELALESADALAAKDCAKGHSASTRRGRGKRIHLCNRLLGPGADPDALAAALIHEASHLARDAAPPSRPGRVDEECAASETAAASLLLSGRYAYGNDYLFGPRCPATLRALRDLFLATRPGEERAASLVGRVLVAASRPPAKAAGSYAKLHNAVDRLKSLAEAPEWRVTAVEEPDTARWGAEAWTTVTLATPDASRSLELAFSTQGLPLLKAELLDRLGLEESR